MSLIGSEQLTREEKEFGRYMKKYGVSDPDNPLHHYNYRAAFSKGIKPEKWEDLPVFDRVQDIMQAMQGKRIPGRRMSFGDAVKLYSGKYFWPDTDPFSGFVFKSAEHNIPPLF